MIIQQLLGPNGMLFCTEDDQGKVDIFWGGILYYSFYRNDLLAKNIGISIFANNGVLRKTICDFFKVNRRTVTNILAIYKDKGIDGLKDHKPGPASIEYELKQFVIKKYIELEGTRGYQKNILKAVEEKVKEGDFKKGICRSMMHNILKEYKAEREEQKRKNLEERKACEAEEENRKKGKEDKAEDEQIELIREIAEGEEVCVEHGGAAVATIFLDDYGTAEDIPESDKEKIITATRCKLPNYGSAAPDVISKRNQIKYGLFPL